MNPIKGITVIDKETKKEYFAIYAPNRLGNMRYNIEGKFYSDKNLNHKFLIKHETDIKK